LQGITGSAGYGVAIIQWKRDRLFLLIVRFGSTMAINAIKQADSSTQSTN
jgi:hypothetical protein